MKTRSIAAGSAIALSAGLILGSVAKPAAANLTLPDVANAASAILVDNATSPSYGYGDLTGYGQSPQSNEDTQDDEGQAYPIDASVLPGAVIGSVGDIIRSTDNVVYPVDPTYVDGENENENDSEENDGEHAYAGRNDVPYQQNLPQAIVRQVLPGYGVNLGERRYADQQRFDVQSHQDDAGEAQQENGNDD